MKFDNLKMWTLGLVVACPFNNELNDCPLAKIRKLSLSERFEYIEKMDDEQKKSIINHHKLCLAERENKINPAK